MQTTPKYIDIGVNLTNKRFDKDRGQIILEAEQNGVIHQIITGTNLIESEKAYQLSQNYPGKLFSTAGCHPHEAKDFQASDISNLQALLGNKNVVAVGECGLDFNRNYSPKQDQLRVFELQLELSIDCQKPLFLHERDAFEEQYKLLKRYSAGLVGGVIHCFTGTEAHMKAYLDLGLHVGITGWICDERRGFDLYNMVHQIPNNRLLLETDAPFLLPRDMRPKPKSSRNLPKYLPHIAKTIAEARNQNHHDLASHCFNNSTQLFNL